MGRHMVILEHIEDIALVLGSISLAMGTAFQFGASYGLMSAGLLSIAYGVWISPRRV